MAKINASDFGPARGKITPNDLEADIALLTISSAEVIDVPDEEAESGVRRSLCLNFEETGDKALWPNKSNIETLAALLGDETDGWLGKVVPVEKAHVPFRGQTYYKVRIMDASEWEDVFKEAGVKYPYKSVKQERVIANKASAKDAVKSAKRK